MTWNNVIYETIQTNSEKLIHSQIEIVDMIFLFNISIDFVEEDF